MIFRHFTIGILFLIGALLTNEPLSAQLNPFLEDRLTQQDTIQYAFVPALAYTSDDGLIAGGLISRFDYTPGFSPYRNNLRTQLLLSTKGMVNFRTIFEHTQTFGRDIRSQWDVSLFRLFDDNYFGIGNLTTYDEQLRDNRFYNYESRSARFTYRGRVPLLKVEPRKQLDFIFIGTVSYTTDAVPEDEISLINTDRPTGFDGGFVNYPGIGLHWENRDSEFAPTRGNTFRMETFYSGSMFGSDFDFFQIYARASQFHNISFLANTVVAVMAGTEWVSGETPYWFLPYVGGEERVRGYQLFRFRGDGALWYSLELRNWVYENPGFQFKAGLHVFTDGGKVFTSGESFTFDELHTSYGFGTSCQLFTPDFILRIEYAKSDELGRIYMGVGYMF